MNGGSSWGSSGAMSSTVFTSKRNTWATAISQRDSARQVPALGRGQPQPQRELGPLGTDSRPRGHTRTHPLLGRPARCPVRCPHERRPDPTRSLDAGHGRRRHATRAPPGRAHGLLLPDAGLGVRGGGRGPGDVRPGLERLRQVRGPSRDPLVALPDRDERVPEHARRATAAGTADGPGAGQVGRFAAGMPAPREPLGRTGPG